MSRLYATKYCNKWFVSNNRVSGYTRICGDGDTLPAAYLDYLREQDKHDKRVGASKAEEARIVDLIKRKSGMGGYIPEMDMLPESVYDVPKKKGLFAKVVRYITK